MRTRLRERGARQLAAVRLSRVRRARKRRNADALSTERWIMLTAHPGQGTISTWTCWRAGRAGAG